MAFRHIGTSPERVEDAALLTGRGRFMDDLPVPAGALHAAILRSPHPHADIRAINAEAALALPGVAAVVTGAQVKALTRPFIVVCGPPSTITRLLLTGHAMWGNR